MPVYETKVGDVVVRRYNDDDRLYSEWDIEGTPVVLDEPYSATQNEAADARSNALLSESNEDLLLQRARAALTSNKAWLERSTTPTNAQVVAHIDRLTRQVNALIRLKTRELLEVDDT